MEGLYPNQIETASLIRDKFFNDSHYVILNAEPQVGKTGTIVSLIKDLEEKEGSFARRLGINKFIYLIGENQDVKDQTIADFERHFDLDKMYMLSDFRKNSDMRGKNIFNLETLRNALILIDESHYGTSKENNVLPHYLSMIGINHMRATEELIERNIYVVSISATPWVEISSDIALKKDIIDMQIPETYFGITKMIMSGMLQPIKFNITKNKMDCYSFVNDIVLPHINDIHKKRGVYKATIMRVTTPRGNDKRFSFTKLFGDKFHVIDYSGRNINPKQLFYDIQNSQMLYDKPLLVIIKGTFRMGKRIPDHIKDMIGVIYDFSNYRIETTVQGLLGRMCGHITKRVDDNYTDTKLFISSKHFADLYEFFINGNKTKYLSPQDCSRTKVIFEKYHPIIQSPIGKRTTVEVGEEMLNRICGDDWINDVVINKKNAKVVDLLKSVIPNYTSRCNLGRRWIFNGNANEATYMNFDCSYTDGFQVYTEDNVKSGKIFYPVVIDTYPTSLKITYQGFRMIYNPVSEKDYMDKKINRKIIAPTMNTGLTNTYKTA